MIKIHEKWMKYAINEAQNAYKNKDLPIGAVIVCNGKIIAKGFNQVELLNDATAHAEILAITSASNYNNDWRLNNASLYVTKEPCIMCYGAILNSRIKNLYYGVTDEKNGFKINLANLDSLNIHLDHIESDILGFKCKNILIDFFKNKRKNNKIK